VCQPGGLCAVACDSDGGDGGAAEILCTGACVSPDDVNHCGTCTNTCAAPPSGNGTATCPAAQCVMTCISGYHPAGAGCNTDCLANTDDPSVDPCVVTDGLGAFVSPTGNDTTGDGSKEHPFGSIGHAMDTSARVYACGTFTGEQLVVSGTTRDGTSVYGGPARTSASEVAVAACLSQWVSVASRGCSAQRATAVPCRPIGEQAMILPVAASRPARVLLCLALFAAGAVACDRIVSIEANDNKAILHFAPAVHYPLQGGGTSSAIGDFDGDGAKDIAIGGNPTQVAFGAGDGTFGPLVAVASGLRTIDVLAADVNGDGRDDLLLSADTAHLYLCLGSAQQRLGAPTDTNGAGGAGMFLADVDGDGVEDVLADDPEGGTFISYFAAGGQSVRTSFFYDGFGASYAADLNGDGRADLVGFGTNVALTGAGGEPAAFVTFPVSGADGLGGTLGADVNGDGLVDAVTEDGAHDVFTQLARPDGTLGSAVVTQNPFGSQVDALLAGFADFDGDGVPDGISLVSDASVTMGFMKGNGAGGFTRLDSDLAPDLDEVLVTPAVGDLDGDGQNDIVLMDETSFVVLLNRTR
jgi:hypothetical protein